MNKNVYEVVSEWKCGKVDMVTVRMAQSCSVIEKTDWVKLTRGLTSTGKGLHNRQL